VSPSAGRTQTFRVAADARFISGRNGCCGAVRTRRWPKRRWHAVLVVRGVVATILGLCWPRRKRGITSAFPVSTTGVLRNGGLCSRHVRAPRSARWLHASRQWGAVGGVAAWAGSVEEPVNAPDEIAAPASIQRISREISSPRNSEDVQDSDADAAAVARVCP
jgi:hypothetical protein